MSHCKGHGFKYNGSNSHIILNIGVGAAIFNLNEKLPVLLPIALAVQKMLCHLILQNYIYFFIYFYNHKHSCK